MRTVKLIRILVTGALLAVIMVTGMIGPALAQGDVTVSINAPNTVQPDSDITVVIDVQH